MGWDMEIHFFVPRENMTEQRFADTLFSLSDLPMTRVPVIKPNYPDAPMFSSIELTYHRKLVQGIYMDFGGSTTPFEEAWCYSLPEDVELFIIGWRKTDFSQIEPYNHTLMITIKRIAETLGALYAAYSSDIVWLETKRFEDAIKTVHAYHFFCTDMVDILGRGRIEERGTVIEANNGLVLLRTENDWKPMLRMLEDLWTKYQPFKGKKSNRRYERPSFISEVQLIDDPPKYDWEPDLNTIG